MSRPVPTLGNPKNTIEILNKYKFVFQKKFGQNFLIDEHVLGKIIRSAEITEDDFVVEIGPGIGTLTQYLAASAREVAAIEIDDALIPILEDTLSAYDNVTVIHEDVLKVDLCKLAEEKNGGKPIKVVANLPYYITTPIIMGLFENHVPVESITIMVRRKCRSDEDGTRLQRLRRTVPGRTVLRKAGAGGQCAAQLFHAPAQGRVCGDPPDPLCPAAGAGGR